MRGCKREGVGLLGRGGAAAGRGGVGMLRRDAACWGAQREVGRVGGCWGDGGDVGRGCSGKREGVRMLGTRTTCKGRSGKGERAGLLGGGRLWGVAAEYGMCSLSAPALKLACPTLHRPSAGVAAPVVQGAVHRAPHHRPPCTSEPAHAPAVQPVQEGGARGACASATSGSPGMGKGLMMAEKREELPLSGLLKISPTTPTHVCP